jgi:hypothetical protein
LTAAAFFLPGTSLAAILPSNARLRDERAAAPDEFTGNERAMAKSAEKKRNVKKDGQPKRMSTLNTAGAVLRKAGKPTAS